MDRRGFFSSSAMAAAGTLPSYAAFAAAMSQPAAPLPDAALYDKDEEAYWTQLRKQFLIPSDEVYLNNGTVGSSPWPVLKAVFDAYTDAERLALKAGDEVLMTDQEHPGGEHPWNLRAKRYGIVVKKVVLPKPVPNAATVLNLFNDAITSRTRVIFVSHVTTVTGVVLPAKELCALARSKGLLSAVDGAHVTGMMSLNVTQRLHSARSVAAGCARWCPELKSARPCSAPRRASSDLLDATLRLLRLLERPADMRVMAPFIEQEILYRLLSGPVGPRLVQIAMSETPSHRIASALSWLKKNFARPLRIGVLARSVGMSESAFR